MHAAISYLQQLFVPSYLTVLYAFLSGAAYGIIGSKLGFAATTVLSIIGAVGYAVYAAGGVK
jgi:hypothetical protein